MKQGDSFTANVRGIDTTGRISFCRLMGMNYMVLCQNDIKGGNDNFKTINFERYGYEYIYVLDKYSLKLLEQNRHLSIRNFQLISNRKKRIENLKI